MSNRDDPDHSKERWVSFQRPGFLVLEPDGPWIECFIKDVSGGSVSIDVGSLQIPKTFVLLMSPKGEVRRLCQIVWRRGELLVAKFVTPQDIASDSQK
jgi:hypothetical protein